MGASGFPGRSTTAPSPTCRCDRRRHLVCRSGQRQRQLRRHQRTIDAGTTGPKKSLTAMLIAAAQGRRHHPPRRRHLSRASRLQRISGKAGRAHHHRLLRPRHRRADPRRRPQAQRLDQVHRAGPDDRLADLDRGADQDHRRRRRCSASTSTAAAASPHCARSSTARSRSTPTIRCRPTRRRPTSPTTATTGTTTPRRKMLYADFGGTLGDRRSEQGRHLDPVRQRTTANGGHSCSSSRAGARLLHASSGSPSAPARGAASTPRRAATPSITATSSSTAAAAFSSAPRQDDTATGNTVTTPHLDERAQQLAALQQRQHRRRLAGGARLVSQSNALAQGNVIYVNGGEGHRSSGDTDAAGYARASNNVVRNNVIFDNFSVNIYVDNTQNALRRAELRLRSPARRRRRPSTTCSRSRTATTTDFGKRMTPVNISLADEPGSAYDGRRTWPTSPSSTTSSPAASFGFVDYDDGTSGPSATASRTASSPTTRGCSARAPVPGQQSTAGGTLSTGANPDASTQQPRRRTTSSSVPDADDYFVARPPSGVGPGINNDYNLYSGPGTWADHRTRSQRLHDLEDGAPGLGSAQPRTATPC